MNNKKWSTIHVVGQNDIDPFLEPKTELKPKINITKAKPKEIKIKKESN